MAVRHECIPYFTVQNYSPQCISFIVKNKLTWKILNITLMMILKFMVNVYKLKMRNENEKN